jgi:hypothetical protein
MAIGAALRTFLLADAAIAAAIVEPDGTKWRIYPVQLPQGLNQLAIRYTIISGQRPHASPQGAMGLSGPRIQIDVWGPVYAPGVHALAELIRKRLDGYRGAAGSGGDATTIQGAFFADERDGYEPESKLYFFSRDYFVWFEEAIA